MEGNLIVVYAGEHVHGLEFSQIIFSYSEVVLVLIKNIKTVNEYAEKHDKEVITLESLQEALDLFGPDKTYRLGETGKRFDLDDVSGDLKEGKTIMLIFGDKDPDTTTKKWMGDIASASILLYELDKLVELGTGTT